MAATPPDERAALVDTLRNALAETDWAAQNYYADLIEADGKRIAAMQEAIADAPHDTANGCRSGWHKTLPNLGMGEALPCTCWKSRV